MKCWLRYCMHNLASRFYIVWNFFPSKSQSTKFHISVRNEKKNKLDFPSHNRRVKKWRVEIYTREVKKSFVGVKIKIKFMINLRSSETPTLRHSTPSSETNFVTVGYFFFLIKKKNLGAFAHSWTILISLLLNWRLQMQSNFLTARHIRKSPRSELGNYFVTNNSVRDGSKGHEFERKYGD